MSGAAEPDPALNGFSVQNQWGRTVRDPTAGQLWRVLAELTAENRFAILTPGDGLGSETYAQVYFQTAGHYDVEYRDGSAEEHYAAVAPDVPTAQAVLAGWAEQRPGWRDTLAWQKLEID